MVVEMWTKTKAKSMASQFRHGWDRQFCHSHYLFFWLVLGILGLFLVITQANSKTQSNNLRMLNNSAINTMQESELGSANYSRNSTRIQNESQPHGKVYLVRWVRSEKI